MCTGQGLEPQLMAPETIVLPLDDPVIFVLDCLTEILLDFCIFGAELLDLLLPLRSSTAISYPVGQFGN